MQNNNALIPPLNVRMCQTMCLNFIPIVLYSAPVAHTWDLKIGKCYIHTQLVTGVIGRQNHNVANTSGVTNMVSCIHWPIQHYKN